MGGFGCSLLAEKRLQTLVIMVLEVSITTTRNINLLRQTLHRGNMIGLTEPIRWGINTA